MPRGPQDLPVSHNFRGIICTPKHHIQDLFKMQNPQEQAVDSALHKREDKIQDNTDDLESVSSGSTASKHTTSDYEAKEDFQIAKKESRHVFFTRAIVLLVLVGVATAVSVVVFLNSTKLEHDAFVDHFYEVASKLALEFQGSAFRCIEASEGFSNQITAYAISSKSEWPNVVIPEFERRVKYDMEVSHIQSVSFFPIVNETNRQSWEAFSVANQGWLKDGLAVQGLPVEDWDRNNINLLESIWGETPGLEIPETITKLGPDGAIPEDAAGPFAPVSILEMLSDKSLRSLLANMLLPSYLVPMIALAVCPSFPRAFPGKPQRTFSS